MPPCPPSGSTARFEDESTASVSLRDAGLLHGAGVFTTMRSYGGKSSGSTEHLRRLRDSCEALFIPLQYKDDVLTGAADELLRRNGLSDARLRLTVTRGASTPDPLHGSRLEPTAFLTAAPLEPYPHEYYERGLTAVLLDEQKLNPYDLQAGHKTLNYFSRLAALREANRRGAGEALWFNVHNYLQSGSISNVFLVKDGVLLTPPTPQELREDKSLAAAVPYPKSNVLPGVTRGGRHRARREGRHPHPLAGDRRQPAPRRRRGLPHQQHHGRDARLPPRTPRDRRGQAGGGDDEACRGLC